MGVASQLITSPKILFLDEPTSGLDSAASWEVVKYLKGVAKRNNVCFKPPPSFFFPLILKKREKRESALGLDFVLILKKPAHRRSLDPPAVHVDLQPLRQAPAPLGREAPLLRPRDRRGGLL